MAKQFTVKKMKLKNLFARRVTVAEGLRLPVSRHFHYSTFAVRGRHESGTHLSMFVVEGTPGTGFFVRNSESHSYRRFVVESQKKNQQSFLTLLLRKEPDFEREYKRVNEAFGKVKNEQERRILSCYQNVLGLARDEEQLQRIVRAIKDRIEDKPSKSLVSVLSHYKSSIASLEHDAAAAQLSYGRLLDEEQLAAWGKVVDAFHLIVESRRVWSVFTEDGKPAYKQVFFDMGVFDYIKSPGETPVMRDYNGVHYYLYPDGMVVGRSSVDFDFHAWNTLDVNFSVVDISTLAVRPQFNLHKYRKRRHVATDALSTLYGTTRAQVVGEIYIPQIDRKFYVNHTGPAEDFAKALSEWKKKSK